MTMIMATGIYNHEKFIWPTISTLYIDFIYKQLHAYKLKNKWILKMKTGEVVKKDISAP